MVFHRIVAVRIRVGMMSVISAAGMLFAVPLLPAGLLTIQLPVAALGCVPVTVVVIEVGRSLRMSTLVMFVMGDSLRATVDE